MEGRVKAGREGREGKGKGKGEGGEGKGWGGKEAGLAPQGKAWPHQNYFPGAGAGRLTLFQDWITTGLYSSLCK